MISCVYCGGAHARPADVKQCWADHQGAEAGGPGQSRLPIVGAGGPDGADGALDGAIEAPAARPAPVERPVRPVRPVDAPQRRERRPAVSAPSGPVSVVAVPIRRGPAELGRHVVVAPGQGAPREWRDAERLVVDAGAIADPSAALDALRTAHQTATGLVIELATALDGRPDQTEPRLPHQVGAGFAFDLDELHHLLWSNSIDARSGTGRWALVDLAVAAGATAVDDASGAGDVVSPAGVAVWLDGGPVRHRTPVDGVPVVVAVQVEHGRFEAAAPNLCAADLAADQLAAVVHDGGAARIIAPAGSGKTRVLTERARQLLATWRLPPGAVSLVAFNKRAQVEMRERTADLPELQVRTLNSIALAIVNGTAPFAPQQRRWRTIDEPEVRNLLQRFVTVPRRRNTDPLAPWIDALSLVRLGLVDPAEVEVRYGGDVDGLADVFPHYLQALEREGAVDFDGQIDRAIQVLLTQPAARRAAQRACRVLLVDEFQDLTPAHLLLIRLLAAPGGAVFGVGDDDQTIYGYNGADPRWLIDFAAWFPGAGDHPLEVNYRCPAGVVEAADRLLRHNRVRVDKTIRAASTDPGGWSATSDEDAVGATVASVRAALDGGAAPSEIAVLTRVNATIAPVQVALVVAGVPIATGVGTEFAERTAVRAALAWLRLAIGRPFSPDDLREALRRPSRPLHPRIGDWVAEQRDVESLRRLADRLTNERDAARVGEFAGDIELLQGLARSGATTSKLVATLIDDIGLGGAVATLDQTRRGMNRAAQGDDLLALRQVARLRDDPAGFEGWLRDHLAARRDADGVVLATVHRVKGQEWPHVVVHLADADQYPHRLSDDLEEERRLFHVAITRASRHATVVSSETASPFVAELTSEPPEHPPEPPATTTARAAAPATKRRRDAPEHPLLDRDVVMAVAGLVLVDQGQEWTITDLEPEAAVAERNGAVRRFRLGAKVETAGRQRGKLGARSGELDEASVRLFDRLRTYRDQARNGKPAYTVFDDKTLAAIATALPTDLDALARVKGVGPAKLEQYGDDVLELAADVLDP